MRQRGSKMYVSRSFMQNDSYSLIDNTDASACISMRIFSKISLNCWALESNSIKFNKYALQSVERGFSIGKDRDTVFNREANLFDWSQLIVLTIQRYSWIVAKVRFKELSFAFYDNCFFLVPPLFMVAYASSNDSLISLLRDSNQMHFLLLFVNILRISDATN